MDEERILQWSYKTSCKKVLISLLKSNVLQKHHAKTVCWYLMIKDVHSANCFPLYRCHSTWRVQNAAGEITVRSRPLCPSCPSLSVLVRPAPCRGRAHPWKMVHGLLFSVQNKSIVISFSIAYIVCSVCRIPAKGLNLLIRSSWESALAFHTGRQHQISRGTFRYTNTFSSLFPLTL